MAGRVIELGSLRIFSGAVGQALGDITFYNERSVSVDGTVVLFGRVFSEYRRLGGLLRRDRFFGKYSACRPFHR